MTQHEVQAISKDIQDDVIRGVEILKRAGCREVYLLGSVAEDKVRPESDIDFAVKGCPRARFFGLQGDLLMELDRSADLIDLDVDPDLTSFLERETRLLRVG
jgi:predicted nucleotidyltransferase